MPNRALRISEQVTMAATPRLTEVMVASVGRLNAPRYPAATILQPAKK